MARNKKKRDEGGGASWMDTYGDLVTLLLCFFVMLFASSTISEEKWMSIVEAFTGSPAGTLIEPIDIQNPTAGGISSADGVQHRDRTDTQEEEADTLSPEEQAMQEEIDEQINELYEMLNQYVQDQGFETTLILEREGMYINLTIAEGILFDSGRSNIRDQEAEDVLTAIGVMIDQYVDSISKITIEGHTDNVPIMNPVPGVLEDNLDLSTQRANNVTRWISQHSGIEMSMFDSLGKSEWDPIASNDTEDGRQKNRRVRIVIMAKDAREVMNMAEQAGGEIQIDSVIDVETGDGETTISSLDE